MRQAWRYIIMDKKQCISEATASMEKTISHFQDQLLSIRAGKASPSMLAGIMVEYYGTPTPIEQVSSINTPDAHSIIVQPWEKALIPEIEKAILNANLGFNPQNNGETVRVNVPPLTEERRKDLVKQAKAEAETAKISIRNARRDANETLKKLQKDGLAEDEAKAAEGDVQKLTDKYNAKIDELAAAKEKEIMTV